MADTISEGQDPRILLLLTEGRDQCLGGTAIYRKRLSESLYPQGRVPGMGNSQFPHGEQDINRNLKQLENNEAYWNWPLFRLWIGNY